jgi:hypothetical protein
MKQRGHVALQHRGLRDDPDDNEFVDSGSIRPDQRARNTGSVVVGHRTRESFMRSVCAPAVRCLFCPGFADGPDHLRGCPTREPISGAEACAGLRAAFSAPPLPKTSTDLRDEGRNRMARRREYFVELATDSEIRQATRTGGEQ